MLHIYVDADACPVKTEIFLVARRYGLNVTLVANARMRLPDDVQVSLQVVENTLDAADDWIAQRAEEGDIVITSDIPLASRCIEKGARVVSNNGKLFTEDNIGDAVAMRDLLFDLRESGEVTGGPAPMNKRDRSRFLQKLDESIQCVRRG